MASTANAWKIDYVCANGHRVTVEDKPTDWIGVRPALGHCPMCKPSHLKLVVDGDLNISVKIR